MTHGLYLTLAIILEVIGTTALKLSNGFTVWLPSAAMVVCYAGSFWLLSLSLRTLDVGVSYAIWSGAGTALIALVGFFFFKEPMSWVKALSIALIIAGVMGLQYAKSS